MDPVLSAEITARPTPRNPPRNEALWSVARDLEASFLAEMLKSAGVGRTPEGFGGGAGEDHFATFLTREYADATVRAGGIGLSEAIYRALAQHEEPPS
jgi:Rod binding domain-containing protein